MNNKQLFESEALYRATLDALSDAVHVVDRDLRIVIYNERFGQWCRQRGIAGDVSGKTLMEVFSSLSADRLDQYRQVFETGISIITQEETVVGGRLVVTSSEMTAVRDGDAVKWVLTIESDITSQIQKVETQAELMTRKQRGLEALTRIAASPELAAGDLKSLVADLTESAAGVLEVARVGVWLFEEEGTLLVNLDTYDARTEVHTSGDVLEEHAYRDEFAVLKNSAFVDADDPLNDPRTAGYVEGYLKPHRITSMLDVGIRSRGTTLGVLCFEHVDTPHQWAEDEITFACQMADQIALALSNQERRRAEEEKAQMEGRLIHAQKMEAVGRLAGGVAHDLNNMLAPILGYSEMLLEDLAPDDACREGAAEILRAGNRARELVQQLLAYSRKQPLVFAPVGVNSVIEDLGKLLRRVVREDIAIRTVLAHDVKPVMADVGQITQVIMNLAVNAQDAMPGGGKLILETKTVELDSGYAADHPGIKTGSYVMMAVSDNGCGMDRQTQASIFEPFFSTKGELGTGLGLATVYGIVKQHGGYIWVYSEPDVGTTFKVYLPVSENSYRIVKDTEKPLVNLRGTETILLVEDNPQVRKLTATILERLGYRVVAAANGSAALRVLGDSGTPLHLLLTDVVMPGMNGKDLYQAVAEKQPCMKVVYMSGYTDSVIEQAGVVEVGVPFLQKPFTKYGLAKKIRDVLDA